jgi:hypothetical protein
LWYLVCTASNGNVNNLPLTLWISCYSCSYCLPFNSPNICTIAFHNFRLQKGTCGANRPKLPHQIQRTQKGI